MAVLPAPCGTEPNGDQPAPEKEKILSATKGFPVAESISALPFAPMGEVIANAPPEPDWLWTGYVAPGALSADRGSAEGRQVNARVRSDRGDARRAVVRGT